MPALRRDGAVKLRGLVGLIVYLLAGCLAADDAAPRPPVPPPVEPGSRGQRFRRPAAAAAPVPAAASTGAPAAASAGVTLAASAPPPAPAVAVEPATEVSFLAVGDLIVSRRVARAMAAAGDPLRPFRDIGPLLQSADFVFGNFESPLPESSRYPVDLLAGLVRHRFRVVSLANNHAMDRGAEGLRYTLGQLRGRGIATVGAGGTLAEAWTPAVVSVRGVRIGFVAASYASVNRSRKLWNDSIARLEHKHRLRAAVSGLRARGVDFIVVAMHEGAEYQRRPNFAQQLFARAAVSFGADVVIGTHPHVVQTVEIHEGRHIFYSLGNFLFDQDKPPQTKETVVVRTVLRRGPPVVLDRFEVIPVVNPDTLAPRPATAAEGEPILRRMGLAGRILEPPPAAGP